MALLPQATWNPTGTTPGGYMDPRVVIFHVTAGLGDAAPHDGLEWHFEVSLSGAIEQGVDTNQQAAANYKANPFAISIETEGLGDGEWTAAQLDSLVLLSEWAMANHPLILRQRCPTWDGSGFGYHVMFGAPGPWTPVAKSCPGPNRIRQFDEVLLPRILNPQEDDMTLNQELKDYLDGFRKDVLRRIDGDGTTDDAGTRSGVMPLLTRILAGTEPTAAGVSALLGRAGGVDEAALAAEIVASMSDSLKAKVKEALREGTG